MTDGLETRVAIAGGGLAGLTMASVLGSRGVDCVVIDRQTRDETVTERFDGRTTALSLGSRRVLEAAGLWDGLAPNASPILDIRIADDADTPLLGGLLASASLHFDHREVADDTGGAAFGHIVENRLIRKAQYDRLDGLAPVTHLDGAAITGAEFGADRAVLTLGDGRRVGADLVVAADGKDSLMRELAGIGTRRWSYGQTAVVCTITHPEPHRGLALEHFLPDGPLAVLPMTDGPDGAPRSSVVWSDHGTAGADRPRLLKLADADFEAALTAAMGGYLGKVRLAGTRFAYPLGVVHAKRYTGRRLALIGEAAHAIHPIAGQGLNLSLRDVAALAERLVRAARLGQDLGAAALLAGYRRQRQVDNLAMLAATDGLNRLFSTDLGPVRLARSIGLAAIGRLPPAKRFFMRQAMGAVGWLPAMVRGDRI